MPAEKTSFIRLEDIKKSLQADVIVGEDRLDTEIRSIYASDLMSDVLAFGEPGILLLTGLSNTQSVRTADVIEAKAVIYVRGKKPDKEGIEIAKAKRIPMLSTNIMMYKACGILYSHGLPGVSDLKKG